MADIAVDHLLAAIGDALTLPRPVTPTARLAYLELSRDRAAAVRRAVDHARETGDLSRAADLVDEAIGALPVTYLSWSPVDTEVPR